MKAFIIMIFIQELNDIQYDATLPQNILQNDIWHTQLNDSQYSYTQHFEIWIYNAQHFDTQHYSTKHIDTFHKGIHHNDFHLTA